MTAWARRDVLRLGGLGAGIAAASLVSGAVAACSPGAEPRVDAQAEGAEAAPVGAQGTQAAEGPTRVGEPLGDGSTSRTGPQPHQPTPERLAPGATPPQFVVISWDGAAELSTQQLTRFRSVAQDVGGAMTLFLSGIYVIPEARAKNYRPPRRPAGSSDIPFLTEASVRRTLTGIGTAWTEGHEIGTHFNGHFCGPNGVSRWSTADWQAEIDEVYRLVTSWRTLTGYTDLPSLPFDYRAELIGGRTPCLEGRTNLLPVAKKLGWRYDSSGTRRQTWPARDKHGLWDVSMATVPFKGPHGLREVVSMDYNFMYQFAKDDVDAGTAAQRAAWRTAVTDALLAGFDRAYGGNRAPLIIGNHFEQWNGGIYMDAVEKAMREMAGRPEVRFVSFRQLIDWMEAQDEGTLAALQRLDVGKAPQAGWATLTGSATRAS